MGPQDDPSLIGTTLEGRYEIVEKLGSGAMGTVYRARQLNIDRDVAVKVLTAAVKPGSKPSHIRERFEGEARIISRLRHPNTIKLFDFGKTPDDRPYLVMELLRGRPLDALIAEGPLDEERTIRILRQVAESLAEAHQQGVIHRDLKPANIFVDRLGAGDDVKVIDFGIAKVTTQSFKTTTGVVFGTPAYMSPEQAQGLELDARSDLYSLGVVAYHCLAGRMPFEAETPVALLVKHINEPPPPLASLQRPVEVSAGLERLLQRLLAKQPQDRPSSALEVRDALAALARPPAPTPAPAPALSRRFCTSCGAEAVEGARFCPVCGHALAAEVLTPQDRRSSPLLNTTLDGKFLLQELLGVGGMGKVYKALQLSLDKVVCVKVLRPGLAQDQTMVKRFKREARAASRLSHPNCIQVIDFGQAQEDGALYLAMEHVPGRSLDKVIAQEWPLPAARIVHLMGQVLSALADAHAAGIIHRDLKPENIMVADLQDTKDFVKVLDFGIAKIQADSGTLAGLTGVGMVCGTPEYMSPEQARGEELDARSDVYAAGVILYQLVVGKVPFTSSTAMGIVTKHLSEPPLPPSQCPGVGVSPGLEAVILKAMSKDRDRRQPTAKALRDELDTVLSREAVRAQRAGTSPEPTGGSSGARGRHVLAGLGAALVAVGLGAVLLWPRAEDQEIGAGERGIITASDAGVSVKASGPPGPVAAEPDVRPVQPIDITPDAGVAVAVDARPRGIPGESPGKTREADRDRLALEALEKEIRAAVSRQGIIPRDLPELDALRNQMVALKAKKRLAEALVVGRRAQELVGRTRIDKAFVDSKLVRFNQLFSKLPEGAGAGAAGLMEQVMDALDRNDLAGANRALNLAFGLLRKGEAK